jgi:hypothetical protein
VIGSPEQFGAFSPAGDFVTVGRTLSQHFLPLVAEISIANPLHVLEQFERWKNPNDTLLKLCTVA